MEILFTLLRIILAVLIVALISAITVVFLKSFSFRQKIKVKEGMNVVPHPQAVSEEQYTHIMHHKAAAKEKWENILNRIKDNDERDLNMAIIKADSLFDEILMEHGCEGKDMGDRLKTLNHAELKNLNDVWEAHKIRNRLSHDPDFHVKPEEARRVIDIYHAAINEILSKEVEMV